MSKGVVTHLTLTSYGAISKGSSILEAYKWMPLKLHPMRNGMRIQLIYYKCKLHMHATWPCAIPVPKTHRERREMKTSILDCTAGHAAQIQGSAVCSEKRLSKPVSLKACLAWFHSSLLGLLAGSAFNGTAMLCQTDPWLAPSTSCKETALHMSHFKNMCQEKDSLPSAESDIQTETMEASQGRQIWKILV